MRTYGLLSIALFLLSTSCDYDSQSRSIRKETERCPAGGVRFIAIGGDAEAGYYFIFFANNHFTISENLRIRRPWGRGRYYEGQYEARHDTLFLTSFYKDVCPSRMAEFIIKDTSRLLVLWPYKGSSIVMPLIPKRLRPDNRGLVRAM